MPQIVKKDIQFNSADNRSKIAGYIYTHKSVEPFCVLQISHGMCEYIARYEEFAEFLTSRGVAVCGNDHIGHGASAKTPEDYGFFGEIGGRRFAVQDLKTMNQKAHEAFPELPVVLLGHSMGSFLARKYATEWPNTISGLILSGTAGPNPMAPLGIFFTSLVSKIKGPRYRSGLVHRMAFGAYLGRIKKPKTQYDWISRDEAIVAAYAADEKCTFRFTVNGFHELFSALRDVNTSKWAFAVNKNMPVFLFAGTADPVGNYSKGVQTVHRRLQKAGVKDLSCTLYPGGRHEMLNETNRNEVYENVLYFLQQHCKI